MTEIGPVWRTCQENKNREHECDGGDNKPEDTDQKFVQDLKVDGNRKRKA